MTPRRVIDHSLLVGVILSASAIIILANGVLGTNGAPGLTAAFLFLPTFALICVGDYAGFSFGVFDALYVVFAACVAASTVVNGFSREAALVGLCLLNYPAGRVIQLGSSYRSFMLVTGLVALVGLTVTTPALIQQWSDIGRPFVFGFAHAQTVFLALAGFMAIAVVTVEPSRLATIVIALSAAIYAASMIRFVFVAIVVALFFAMLRKNRRPVVVMVAAVCLAAAVGFAARYTSAKVFLVERISEVVAAPVAGPDGPVVLVDDCMRENNSIKLRTRAISDAMAALPPSGLFGRGIGSLREITCAKIEPHNSFVQTAVEFGWIAGVVLILMATIPIVRLLRLAPWSTEACFVLCCLIYVVALATCYGHVTNDGPLFLFLGYAARIPGEGLRRYCVTVPGQASILLDPRRRDRLLGATGRAGEDVRTARRQIAGDRRRTYDNNGAMLSMRGETMMVLLRRYCVVSQNMWQEPRYFWTLNGAMDFWVQENGRAKLYKWNGKKWEEIGGKEVGNETDTMGKFGDEAGWISGVE
jgi:O-Antigen ligase